MHALRLLSRPAKTFLRTGVAVRKPQNGTLRPVKRFCSSSIHPTPESSSNPSSTSVWSDPENVKLRARVHQSISNVFFWLLGVGVAGYVAYETGSFSDEYIINLRPEQLEELPKSEMRRRLREVCNICVNFKQSKFSIRKSQAYNTLREAIYNEDKYIRLLAIQALTALARESDDLRRRLAQTVDFKRLASEIFSDALTKQQLETDPVMSRWIRRTYMSPLDGTHEAKVVPHVDTMLVYAFDDLMSAVTKHADSHYKLIDTQYVPHLVGLLNSPDLTIRKMAIHTCSGLTRSIEGRKALAPTNAFPCLHDMIYGKNPMNAFDFETVLHGKFAMQQLVLSDSALAILGPIHRDFLNGMEYSTKADLLSGYEMSEELGWVFAQHFIDRAYPAFLFGLAWGALRKTVVPVYQPNLTFTLNSLKNIGISGFNAGCGSIPMVGAWCALEFVKDPVFTPGDSTAVHYGKIALVAGLTGSTLLFSNKWFKYWFIPGFVGLSLPEIKARYLVDSTEYKQRQARMEEESKETDSKTEWEAKNPKPQL